MENQKLFTLLALFFLCPAFPAFAAETSLAAEPADSLAFEAKRRQILERNPDERATLILQAAEDLARDGYYAEALDLIFSLENPRTAADWDADFAVDTAGPPPPKAPAEASRSLAAFASGYVQTVVDYDAWDGLDTSVSGRVRTKMEWDPAGAPVDRVSSVFQGSDRNAYFDLSAKGSAWRRMLKFEADAQAEKKLWQTYRDSLDRFYLQAKLEGNTRALGKPLSMVTPVFAELQQYRYGRFGSQSYRVLGATPGLEAISGDLRKSLILSWELRHTTYPSARPDGNFRSGPVASAEWYGNRITLDAETRFQTTRFFRDTARYRLRELETRGGAFVRTWSWLRAGVRTSGVTETGDYTDSVYIPIFTRILASYQLKGSIWMVQPQLIADWTPAVSMTLSLAYAQARFPILAEAEGFALQTPKYLEETYDDWKPALGVTVLTKAIFFTLSADYEENRVPATPEYNVGSSRGLGLNCDLFWKIRPWLEIDLSGAFSRARDSGPLQGRLQNMRSLSLGLISRFP
ncbi:MAG TPA: hypothetical protein VJ385_11050 [Fibrobacteria bacterium]|nr:hypothetical protein [Fibrobacteria bacterium]